MKYLTKVFVPELGRFSLVSETTIDGKPPTLGDFDQAKIVRRLETHTGRKIKIPEQMDVRFGDISIISADILTVKFLSINKKGKKIEKEVDRAYFIRKYCL